MARSTGIVLTVFPWILEVNVYKEEKRACKLIFKCIHYVVASQLIGKKPNYKNYGIKKISSIKITSSDIKKLQVILTKRLSFKPTFKGHSIITCFNHASTKDVLNTQNQCQISGAPNDNFWKTSVRKTENKFEI